MKSSDLSLDIFWVSVKDKYSVIYREAIYDTTEYYSTGYYTNCVCVHFSYLTNFRSKDRNRLILVDDEISVVDLELSICGQNYKHNFLIKETNLIIYIDYTNTIGITLIEPLTFTGIKLLSYRLCSGFMSYIESLLYVLFYKESWLFITFVNTDPFDFLSSGNANLFMKL